MTILVAPLVAAALFAVGAVLLLVVGRKGKKAGRVFLGALALCTVLGLAVTMALSPDGPFGSSARATSRTMME